MPVNCEPVLLTKTRTVTRVRLAPGASGWPGPGAEAGSRSAWADSLALAPSSYPDHPNRARRAGKSVGSMLPVALAQPGSHTAHADRDCQSVRMTRTRVVRVGRGIILSPTGRQRDAARGK